MEIPEASTDIQQDPNMDILHWKAKEYQTGQYFYIEYHKNLAEQGKKGRYQQRPHFFRRLRAVHIFPRLVSEKHIVQLTWQEFKSTDPDLGLVSDFKKLHRIFALNGYQPILLLDATAQLELTHHLDDELSQEMAYRHSRNAATQQATTQAVLSPEQIIQALAQGHITLTERVGVIEQIVPQLEQRLEANEHQQQEMTTYHEEVANLREKCARLEEQNAVMQGQLTSIIPPKDTKTVMDWCRSLYGEERHAVQMILRTNSVTKYQELGYLEYLCAKELENTGEIAAHHQFPTDFGIKLFITHAVFKQALSSYIAEQKERGFRPRTVYGNQKVYPVKKPREGA